MSSNHVVKKAIYFCGSIRAGRQDVDLYGKLIDKLSAYGEVLTPFVGDKAITATGSEHEGGDKGIHDRDVHLLEQSNGKLSTSGYMQQGIKQIQKRFKLGSPRITVEHFIYSYCGRSYTTFSRSWL